MSPPETVERRRPPVDPRLVAQVPSVRRYLVLAVACGVGLTVSVVVQAVALATVVSRSMLGHQDLGPLVPALVVLGAAFAARAVLGWAAEVAAQRCGTTVTSVLRRRMLAHALALGPQWLAAERVGELSLAATRGIGALRVYFGRYLPQAVLAVVAPVLLVVWVATQDWVSALLLVALLALVPVAMIVFGRRAAEHTRRQWRLLSSLAAHLLELIEGLDTLRAFGHEDRGRREVAEATEGLRRTTMGTLRVAFLSAFSMELLSGLGVGLVAMVLGLRLLDGRVHLQVALAVLLVCPEAFLALRRAGAEFHASTEGQAAGDRLLSVLEQPAAAPAHPAPAAPDPAHGPLTVRDLVVRYPGRAEPAVAGLSVDLRPGRHVVLSGPSGSGKSSALAALLRFTRDDEGTLSCDGVDLRAVDPAAWRRRVGWVPQRPHLFAGTLADNLRLARPGATGDELWEAVQLVGLGRWAAALPGGLETVVGERGLGLSAGERQRVALARLVLRDAPLALLDEPMAHLDAHSEEALGATLGPWLEGRSVLVASHAPVTWCRVDGSVAMAAPAAGPGPRGLARR